MWLIFVGLLITWMAGMAYGIGAPFLHVLLLLAVIDLAVGIARPDKGHTIGQ